MVLKSFRHLSRPKDKKTNTKKRVHYCDVKAGCNVYIWIWIEYFVQAVERLGMELKPDEVTIVFQTFSSGSCGSCGHALVNQICSSCSQLFSGSWYVFLNLCDATRMMMLSWNQIRCGDFSERLTRTATAKLTSKNFSGLLGREAKQKRWIAWMVVVVDFLIDDLCHSYLYFCVDHFIFHNPDNREM